MYRWAACPGSVREAAKAPKSVSSAYAEEGSDAHALAAYCLERGEYSSASHIGEKMEVDGRSFTPDKDMTDAVDVYINHLFDECSGDGNEQSFIEHGFDLSSIHEGCFGTADHVRWRPATKTLTVTDYKHGAGLPVEVENNKQLLYYGLGALVTLGLPAKTVKLTIVQPRCEHPDGPIRSTEIEAFELIEFGAELKMLATATEDPNAPLVPGDHCRFCPAAKDCPALTAKRQLIARSEFSPVLSYDPAKLREALDAIPGVEAQIKAVREFAYAEAEAGRCPPGYKLVAKRATRKWRDEEEAKSSLCKLVTDDDLYEELFEPKYLKSPAQVEKLLGKGKIDNLTISESSGHVLAPEDDKRPAVKLAAKEEFTALPAPG